MNKDIYFEPVAEIVYINTIDIITASDPYVEDIDWDL